MTVNVAGRMDKRAQYMTRSEAAKDALGAVSESWAVASVTVWVGISAPNETTRRRQDRYASPVTALMTCYPHASCVAGNRVTVEGVVYDILGVDATAPDIYHADLAEVL